MSHVYIMLNKPAGYITARTDRSRPTVMEFFPPELKDRIHPVGRLDKDTEGLLLFTDDGSLDNALMQPGRHVGKEYYFRAMGDLTDEKIAVIENGVKLYGEDMPESLPAKVTVISRVPVKELEKYLPSYRKKRYMRNPEGPAVTGTVYITEGKKHQVKLMLKAAHCTVFYLKRLAVGGLRLDMSLRCGEYRELTQEELGKLTAKI